MTRRIFVEQRGHPAPEDWEEQTGVFLVSIPDKQLRRLTPESQNQYKEGLEWHPSGAFLTYLNRGPEKRGSQIRRVFLDNRSSDTLIDQPDHWDYVGLWSPGGRKFFLNTSGCKHAAGLHVYEPVSGKIAHGVRGGWLPEFSADGNTMVWTIRKWLRHFEVIDGFR